MEKEDAIKYLQELYPNGGHCWLDEQRIEAIGMAINALQEEPVSVWHNMDEVPIKGEVIVVQTKDTFYGLSIQKGGTTYKNKNKDRYVRWAYASDLLNLSNVQRTVKNRKEPVSEDIQKIGSIKSHEYYPEKKTTNKTSKGVFDANMPRRKAYLRGFKDGAHAHKELIANKPVSEDLEAAVNAYIGYAPEVDEDLSVYGKRQAFKAGAQWQEKQDKETIELAEDHAMLAGMEKMKQQMVAEAIDVEVKVDAGGYPYIPQMELYDYDKDVPLAKKGDKYKVVLIKDE